MLGDVLEAIGGARTIERTIVVSGDPEAQELAAAAGAEVVPDPADEGHVEAALAGIARAEVEGAERVVLLPGDCPLLDPRELDRLLTGVPERYVAIVPDRHGEGTNALVLSPAERDPPRLRRGQPRPPRRRRPRGRRPLRGRGARLAGLDLDTPADLDRPHPRAATATAPSRDADRPGAGDMSDGE